MFSLVNDFLQCILSVNSLSVQCSKHFLDVCICSNVLQIRLHVLYSLIVGWIQSLLGFQAPLLLISPIDVPIWKRWYAINFFSFMIQRNRIYENVGNCPCYCRCRTIEKHTYIRLLLTNNTKLLAKSNSKNWLRIFESIVIHQKQSFLNKNNVRSRIFKCIYKINS